MKEYVCTVCGFVYSEADGYTDDGVAPGTSWADVPGGWVCPMCGAGKDMFDEA
jgi:rubredoxin